jgi:predicted nucleic acid-binding protein
VTAPEPVLVDTGAWIAFFRGSVPGRAEVRALLSEDRTLRCGPVELELRQGMRRREAAAVLRVWTAVPALPVEAIDFWSAGDLLRDLREGGSTLPSLDGLIAVVALRQTYRYSRSISTSMSCRAYAAGPWRVTEQRSLADASAAQRVERGIGPRRQVATCAQLRSKRSGAHRHGRGSPITTGPVEWSTIGSYREGRLGARAARVQRSREASGACMEQHLQQALLKEYGEVSSNVRMLTDIRFKLLAFLPVATAAAAILKSDHFGAPSLVVSLFGLATTIGLAIYNERNDQLYGALVGRASVIERRLELWSGAFGGRPAAWLEVSLLGFKLRINHGTGIGIIYAAAITFWLVGVYLPVIGLMRGTPVPTTAVTAPTGATVTSTYAAAVALAVLSTVLARGAIRRQRKAREKRMRILAVVAVERSKSVGFGAAAGDEAFVQACAELAGVEPHTIRSRATYYGRLEEEELRQFMPTGSGVVAGTHFLALITDLPQPWILDTVTGRRRAAPLPVPGTRGR